MADLAKIVEDGVQIWVPYQIKENVNQDDLEIESVAPTLSQFSNQININTATQSELESLSGIGPVYAKAIIQYRLENGPFEQIEDIQEVKGIGPVTFEKIRPHITVRGGSGN